MGRAALSTLLLAACAGRDRASPPDDLHVRDEYSVTLATDGTGTITISADYHGLGARILSSASLSGWELGRLYEVPRVEYALGARWRKLGQPPPARLPRRWR